jgi:4'-phosphopantetheinyl transferase
MTHPCTDRPALSSGEIHVWTARLVDDDHAAPDLLRILSQEERARATQFSFERDRRRFIQAHGIVRRILAHYCDVDAVALTFARNRHGKPYLVQSTNAPNLQFSVSHSGNRCMLAVRLDHSVGIDVERVHDMPRAMPVAQSYFKPAESRFFATLQGAARRDAFFVLWTLKEAMVKGLGVSLAANLARVEFDLDPIATPRLVAWGGDRSVAQRWSVLRLDAAPGYVAAVASLHPIRSVTRQNCTALIDPAPIFSTGCSCVNVDTDQKM